jgi:hypothetical protein
MFGDERGGGTNVKYGLKPMKNAEAQEQYYNEVAKVVEGLNVRYVRARLPELSPADAQSTLDKILRDRETVHGVSWEELVHMPDKAFFRRRGVPAFEMTGWEGETFDDVDAYAAHLSQHLPDAYRASSDFLHYLDTLRKLHTGEIELKEAVRSMPSLRRVGGVCPCSKSVRWVSEPVAEGEVAVPPSTPQPA